MKTRLQLFLFGAPILALLIIVGCGGGGGGVNTTSTNGATNGSTNATDGSTGSIIPTAKTKADVGANVSAYGDAFVSPSFFAFGPKLHQVGAFLDPALGLWATVQISPAGFVEQFYKDQAKTMPAGSLVYSINDAAFTTSGDINIDEGMFKGLVGTYFDGVQPSGHNGNINYSTSDGTTVVSQFVMQTDTGGNLFGTATIGASLGDYSQTELATYNADGTAAFSSTDSNSIATTLTFNADLSGSGQITGSDPGLPATLNWDSSGTGHVTFADHSQITIAHWKLLE